MASYKPTLARKGLLNPGTDDKTVYGVWSFKQSHVDHYEVVWRYRLPDNNYDFLGENTTTTGKEATYTPPDRAVRVYLKVRPVSETHKVKSNGKEVEQSYWTGSWMSELIYVFEDKEKNPDLEVPEVPTVSIDKYTLTGEVDHYDKNATHIQFRVVADDSKVFYVSPDVEIRKFHASFSCPITPGKRYKVRCRAINSSKESAWSEYSENYETMPGGKVIINACWAITTTSVGLSWNVSSEKKSSNATTYEIEYTTNISNFDAVTNGQEGVQSKSVSADLSYVEITGLESGKEWFFRVRASNDLGSSEWSDPRSIVLGKAPAAPTTWSSTTTAIVGEDLILYWVHNTEDGSSQTAAELELIIDTVKQTVPISGAPSEENGINTYTIKTGSYVAGMTLQWRVRTKGIVAEYSPWSIQRTVNVYAPPTLVLGIAKRWDWYWDPFNFLTDTIYTAQGESSGMTDILEQFPFFVLATAGPYTQKALGYYLTISSTEKYETYDQTGVTVWVNEGEEIYAQYFTSTPGNENEFRTAITASDISLENGIRYKLTCIVSMDSGLTAEASMTFLVAWGDDNESPGAGIGYIPDTLSAYIQPICEDDDGNLIDDVSLSVYRKEFDGSFTELIRDVVNDGTIYIVDPHPALDYARYRIVAKSLKTGAVTYYDPPPYPILETSIVIQWDEEWSDFHVGSEDEDEIAEPPWTGSLLKLPWNVDISHQYDKDTSLVNYIGRKHTVAYYGTRVDVSASWSTDIDKLDEETLYAIRRLANWMGNCYVREPSGTGYWAKVTVSYSRKHLEPAMPIQINVTRVEGGA